MSEPAVITWPHRPPFTVDDLFELPDDGNRYEVLGGQLLVSPRPTPMHQWVAMRLRDLFMSVIPRNTWVLPECAVALPDGDGPVPDVTVTSAHPRMTRRALPVDRVHTVAEIVSPSNAKFDRMFKPQIYGDAGIPCYWRVEIEPWRGYRGRLPLVVVRLLTDDGWRTIEAPAGAAAVLPVVVGHQYDDDGGGPAVEIAEVALDPASLFDC